MKTSKKMLSVVLSLTLGLSAFAGMTANVSAEEAPVFGGPEGAFDDSTFQYEPQNPKALTFYKMGEYIQWTNQRWGTTEMLGTLAFEKGIAGKESTDNSAVVNSVKTKNSSNIFIPSTGRIMSDTNSEGIIGKLVDGEAMSTEVSILCKDFSVDKKIVIKLNQNNGANENKIKVEKDTGKVYFNAVDTNVVLKTNRWYRFNVVVNFGSNVANTYINGVHIGDYPIGATDSKTGVFTPFTFNGEYVSFAVGIEHGSEGFGSLAVDDITISKLDSGMFDPTAKQAELSLKQYTIEEDVIYDLPENAVLSDLMNDAADAAQIKGVLKNGEGALVTNENTEIGLKDLIVVTSKDQKTYRYYALPFEGSVARTIFGGADGAFENPAFDYVDDVDTLPPLFAHEHETYHNTPAYTKPGTGIAGNTTRSMKIGSYSNGVSLNYPVISPGASNAWFMVDNNESLVMEASVLCENFNAEAWIGYNLAWNNNNALHKIKIEQDTGRIYLTQCKDTASHAETFAATNVYLKKNEWNRVIVVVGRYASKADVYVNGELLNEKIELRYGGFNGRWHSVRFSGASGRNLYVDDINFYTINGESSSFRTADKVVRFTSGKYTFNNDVITGVTAETTWADIVNDMTFTNGKVKGVLRESTLKPVGLVSIEEAGTVLTTDRLVLVSKDEKTYDYYRADDNKFVAVQNFANGNAEVRYINNTEEEKSVSLILAIYDAENNFVGCKIGEVTTVSAKSDIVDKLSVGMQAGETSRMFVWDGLNTMMPLPVLK